MLSTFQFILGESSIRWSQGLLFHQAMVDCARAAILLPLGVSILRCEPVKKCSLVETAFLLLVTVSTVNMLTTVLNDSPVFPGEDEDGGEGGIDDLSAPLLMDSPQCVLFGTFMIWFASITINLGPTFLSGALAANTESGHNAPSCPLVHGPFRHYVLNVLWILINVICVLLTLFHLHKLHRDLTKANVEAVRVAGLVTTLVSVTGGGGHGGSASNSTTPALNGTNGTVPRVSSHFIRLLETPTNSSHEITLHVAYVHAFVNPTLFLVLHRGLRSAALDLCCGCCSWMAAALLAAPPTSPSPPPPPPPPPSMPPPQPPPPQHTLLGDEDLMFGEETWLKGGDGGGGGRGGERISPKATALNGGVQRYTASAQRTAAQRRTPTKEILQQDDEVEEEEDDEEEEEEEEEEETGRSSTSTEE
ncbi:hypothetical protein LSTR_LSTR006072 [Laodelphax striatellus]|uniref:G-protein coupled receptors family 1 profile domain-containing protein n=1 Tax=Laodelphax striatellus TaxID=195883 RepID=A0A482XQU1_LAOST|nr:hypothetical protein LSTR_LSTR006072 [Laodelphax striatellus]